MIFAIFSLNCIFKAHQEQHFLPINLYTIPDNPAPASSHLGQPRTYPVPGNPTQNSLAPFTPTTAIPTQRKHHISQPRPNKLSCSKPRPSQSSPIQQHYPYACVKKQFNEQIFSQRYSLNTYEIIISGMH